MFHAQLKMSRIISIEGNIGSGKSTFVKILKSAYQYNEHVIFLNEPVDMWENVKDESGNTMLELFYQDNSKYAFSFQMMAYISRLKLLKETIKKHPYSLIITERCLYSDKEIFAKMLHEQGKMSLVDHTIYLNWFDAFIEDLPPVTYFFVQCTPQICHQRVMKRARQGEFFIPLTYLIECDRYHREWLVRLRQGKKNKIVELDMNANKNGAKDYHQEILKIDREINRTV